MLGMPGCKASRLGASGLLGPGFSLELRVVSFRKTDRFPAEALAGWMQKRDQFSGLGFVAEGLGFAGP